MHFRFGPMVVTVKNTYTHGNAVYYQRHIPADLRGRYPSKIIKRKLGPTTMAPAAIARRVAELDKGYAAEFEGLRAAPDATPPRPRPRPSNSYAAGGYSQPPPRITPPPWT